MNPNENQKILDLDQLSMAASQRIKEKEYWLANLSGEWEKSQFPYDLNMGSFVPYSQELAGADFEFPPQLSAALIRLSGNSDVRLHIILAAGLTALLHRYLDTTMNMTTKAYNYSSSRSEMEGKGGTASSDIVIGTTILKTDTEVDLINTLLPLRNTVQPFMTFKELLLEVQQTTADAMENQNYPMEILAKQLNLSISPAGDFPLFNIAVLLENIHDKKYLHHINLNMILSFLREEASLRGRWEYNPLLYRATTVKRIITHLKNLLSAVTTDINIRLADIRLISEEERKQLLIDFNDTAVPYPDQTLDELFENRAERVPDNIAVIEPGVGTPLIASDPGKQNMQITYQQLNKISNQHAHQLQEKGVKPDGVVAIMMERSIEMIIGILGILKAGGGYLPIDPDYPEERKQYMLTDSSARIILKKSEIRNPKSETNPNALNSNEQNKRAGVTVLDFEHLNFEFLKGRPRRGLSNFEIRASNFNPSNLAYIMYTSGSTGNPKGVMVVHRNVVRLVIDANYVELTGATRILQTGAPVFDATTFEIWGALLNGGQLILVSNDFILNANLLGKTITKYRINTLWLTSPLFNQLAQQNSIIFSGLKYLLVGGDVLFPGTINKVRSENKGLSIINGYGPTENTTFSTTYLVNQDFQKDIPIGKPISNSTAYIINRFAGLQPIGVVGELLVGGHGVSRGYLNAPELTAEKFDHDFWDYRDYHDKIKNLPGKRSHLNKSYRSYRSYSSKKIYKTGDLARWLPDGNIEFLGRIDYQVKIRGFRIELGEIENQLLKHKQIKETVVTATPGKKGEPFLCAYIVPYSPGILEVSRVREYLQDKLPGYMVPSFFVPLAEMPLTRSGKLDRQALPEPGVTRFQEYIAPRNTLEQKLVEIWAGVLGISKKEIGIDDDFFQLGGHSLKATTMVSRVYQELNANIEIAEVFAAPTIRQLAQRIKEREELAYIEIEPAEEKEYYHLSYAQRRLWVLCQFEEDSTAYNIPGAVILSGSLDRDALANAIQKLADRHESLRTIFISVNGDPYQKIIKGFTYHLEEIDLRGLDDETKEKEARAIYIQHANQAFNLEKAPLFQFKLIRLQEQSYLLVHNVHHIISDGWSQGIIHNETIRLYNVFSTGKEFPLAPLRLQYKDYTYWHNRIISEGFFNASREYWWEKFKDKPNGIELPLDYSRKPIQTFNGGRVVFTIDKERTSQLYRLSLQEDATFFMSLLTLLSIFLYRYSGQADIIIGAPIANRKHPELHQMMGFLVNTLIYRNLVTPTESFRELLGKVKQDALACYKYQDYPFDLLVENLELDRDLSQSPLFNVMLAHNNTETQNIELQMEGMTFSGYPHSTDFNMSKFDLIFFMDEWNDEVYTRLEYNSDLFEHSTIRRLADNFLILLDSVIAGYDAPVFSLQLLSDTQYDQVISQFNETRYAFPPLSLQELFEQQAAKSGEKTAVVFNGDMITYTDLNKKINRLAHYLKRKYQIKPNDVIGVSMDRSIEMIVVLGGIIKSGAAYLAVDPTYPRERVLHVLTNSRSDLLIIDKMRPELFGNYTGQILDIYAHEEEISRESDQNPEPVNQLTDILYVNYTSGSTGTPNGAMLSHDCLTNLIQWQNQRTSIDCSLRCLQFTSINFCVSFQEIMGTLTSGGELYLIGDLERQDIDYLMDFLSKNRVEVLFLPFSYLNFLFNESSRWHQAFDHNLKHIITAGEQLKITVGLKRFLDKNPGLKLHNHYGSTEMHVVTSYTLDASSADRTPIPPAGKPISNVSIYILDEYFNPVPVGVWGELWVAGSSEILGYINNSALNQQKLVKHPRLSALHHNQRLFRSGDIGRWLPDGNIELRGRKDFQVKIRGFRVEPGEIESKILSIENVRECVVVVKEDKAKQKYLAAYVAVDNIDLAEIKKKLANKLPQYMVPQLIRLENLPLMPNGKVDRERLPEPEADLQTDYTAPRDELEKNLVRIWSDILEIETGVIGIDGDFFQLGGHSLKATILISKLHKELRVKVQLLDVFHAPTIRELAERIKELKTEEYTSIRMVEEKEYYPASYNQQRLWLLNQGNVPRSTFNMPGQITLAYRVDVTLIKKALNRIIQRHDSFRTGFRKIDIQLVQVVKKEIEIPLEMVDLSLLEPPARENKKQEIYSRELSASFDLNRIPLFRTVLLKLSEENYELLFNVHHIISDGWSTEILKEEFNAIYEAYKKGISCEMKPLKIRYKDYTTWQNQLLADPEKMQAANEFWKSYLEGTLPVMNLPYDFSHDPGSTASSAYRWVISQDLSHRLLQMAAGRHASLFMVLLAAFNIFLSKITAQDEIILAIPAAARQHEELKNIVGLFVNTLIIRTKINGAQDFGDFFQHLQDNTFKILEYQSIPLELICGQLKIKYPTINVFFNMVNIGISNLEKLTDLEDYHMEKVQDAKFDLVCYVSEYKNGIEINCHYFKDRFKPSSIEKLMKLYEQVLDNISADPAKKIGEYTLTGKERTLKRKLPARQPA